MVQQQPVRIGIIGTGGMGTRHAVNLHSYVGAARVSAVYDFDPQRALQAAQQSGGAQVFDDPIALIASDQVDALIIASPDATHVAYTLECLRMQKPVLCEKPLATSAEDARQVIEAETALGRCLISVGFMRRFDPWHVAVQQAAASGELGRPILYKGVHRNAMIPYSVTGDMVLTNSAGHDIDAARWLLGKEVERVYVRGVRSHDSFSPETTDLLLLQMELSGSCLAAIEVFVAAEYGYEVSAEIVAERGSAATLQPDLALVRARQARGVSVPTDWLARFQDAYVAELNDWVRSLRTGRPFGGASTWDGYISLLITGACIESLHSGSPVEVRLSEMPELYRAGNPVRG